MPHFPLTEILQAVDAIFYDCINFIYQFIKTFLEKKISISVSLFLEMIFYHI